MQSLDQFALGQSDLGQVLMRQSPEPFDGKPVEQRLIRYQDQVFALRLSDQQAVEGVLVGDVHLTSALRVVDADRQFAEALFGNDRLEILRQHRRAGQLADPEFGGDLHRRGGADNDLVGLIGDGIAGAAAESFVTRQPPDQRVGIEQKPQARPHPSSSSSGSGSSNRASTEIFPLSAPKRR